MTYIPPDKYLQMANRPHALRKYILKADNFDVMIQPVNHTKRLPSLTFDRHVAAGLWAFVENHFRIKKRIYD